MLKLSCVLAGTGLLMTWLWCFWAKFFINRGEGGNSDPVSSFFFSSPFTSFFFHFTTLDISIFSPVVGCLQDPFLRTNNRGCPLPTSNRQSNWLSLMILATSSTKSVSFLIRTSGKYYTQADLTFRPTPTFFKASFVKYVEYSYSTTEEKPLLVDAFEIQGWPGQ